MVISIVFLVLQGGIEAIDFGESNRLQRGWRSRGYAPLFLWLFWLAVASWPHGFAGKSVLADQVVGVVFSSDRRIRIALE